MVFNVLGEYHWSSQHVVLRQGVNNKRVYVLLADTSINAYCFSGTIECINSGTGNPSNVCCHVYLTANYNGTLSKSVIVPFDGVESRQVTDYTYQGKVYKCIEFNVGQYDSTVITITGFSSNKNSIMIVTEPL